MSMVFVETPVFTEQITSLLDYHTYGNFQEFLANKPSVGQVIPGTGGIRKVRWSNPGRGKGKRGGVRVIYFHRVSESQVILLLAYSKGVQGDLSAKQKNQLKQIVKNW